MIPNTGNVRDCSSRHESVGIDRRCMTHIPKALTLSYKSFDEQQRRDDERQYHDNSDQCLHPFHPFRLLNEC